MLFNSYWNETKNSKKVCDIIDIDVTYCTVLSYPYFHHRTSPLKILMSGRIVVF